MTAGENHPEIERVLGRIMDFAEAVRDALRDVARLEGIVEARLDGIDTRLDRIEARLGTIEDALRGPGRN